MILIVCVDDRGGMMFHQRRQSQDREVRRRIQELAGKRMIWMSKYSARQFEDEAAENIRIDPCFFQKAQEGEFCFLEDPADLAGVDTVEKIVCYHWNRTYPGDAFFSIPLSRWKRVLLEEFAGYSHEKITEEIYIR